VGQIFTNLTVTNPLDPSKQVACRALVDTGSAGLVLPMAWKDRLGELFDVQPISFEVADQRVVSGEVAAPVLIQLEGFRRIGGEVFFMDMRPDDATYEPLLGYVVLEQSLAVVDMIDHRLTRGRHYDLKAVS
jgi:hypothetical protein